MPVDDSSIPTARPPLPGLQALARLPALPRLPFGFGRSPLPLPDPASLALHAFNALLRREAWARERLVRHAGKTVRLTVGAMNAAVTFTSEGQAVGADPAVVPDVVVTLAPQKLTLAALLSLRDSRDGAAIMDITHISGDAGLAQVVGELARHLRLDVEDELAQKIGDVPAARLTQAARSLVSGTRASGQRLAANVAEYLSEERHLLVGRPLFDTHREELAQTAAAVDALDARLKTLALRAKRP